MWSAISKIFTRNSSSNDIQTGEESSSEMDRGERRNYTDMDDTFVSKQAKQRASIKWLLSKAFNNKVPENLREPFYKDHENQEHLKPQIVGALANAEIYCRALANVYSDPNYHNLNHWSILQTLARKGVPTDAQLTETTLIQTNPLKMSAHMAVIESIMLLYAREVLSPDRVVAAVRRFSHDKGPPQSVPETHEQGLLLWVSHACDALKRRIEQDGGMSNGGGDGDRLRPPTFYPPRELKDLCDGVGLAALIAYYCPDELHWTELRSLAVPSVQDSLHNLRLVQDFCRRCLSASIFHLMPEDVTYMRESMKSNLVVFLADLFNVMEINPAKCVKDPTSSEGFPARNEHGLVHKRNLIQTPVTPIPDLRSGLDDPAQAQAFQVPRTPPTHTPLRKTNSLQQSVSEFSEDSLRRGSEESFVVHRGKGIPTLRSVIDEPLIPARVKVNKEKQNNDSKADERGEMAAGKPSNWEDSRKSSFAGRRSRRNSMSDDSQLTIENFGGSQDNINFIGRNPDKEVAVHVGRKISAPSFPEAIENAPVRSSLQDAKGSIQLGYNDDYDPPSVAVHVGRKISAPSFPVAIENAPVRSSLQDARGSIQLGYDDDYGCEKRDDGTEKITGQRLKRQMSSDDITLKSSHSNKENLIRDLVDGDPVVGNRMSFADLGKQKVLNENKGIHLVYMNDREDTPSKSSFLNKLSSANSNGSEKKTSFATLPNTTTWQQQSANTQNAHEGVGNSAEDDRVSPNNGMTVQLSDIRMKLEEKRRHIESEKRRMEVAMNKQRQKVGKAAFLQAVVKGRGNLLKTPSDVVTESQNDSATENKGGDQPPSNCPSSSPKLQRPLTLQEVNDDASRVEQKWLDDSQPFVETRRTPDLENMDLEQYQQSIAQMNSSLSDIQSDIQRLAAQQNQMHTQNQQKLIAEQQRQILQLQHQHQQQQHQQQQQQYQHQPYQSIQPPQYTSQHSYQPPMFHQQPSYAPLQSSSSAPHIPQSLYAQSRVPEQPQFFLHDHPQTPPVAPQRRTWAQQPQPPPLESYQPQPELRTWGSKPAAASIAGGFVLHDTVSERFQEPQHRYQDNSRVNGSTTYHQNGDHEPKLQHSNSFTLSQQHLHQQQQSHPHYGTSHSTPSASPQHRNIHRQISQLLDESKRAPVSLQQIDSRESPQRKTSVIHAPIPAPSADDMEPQNISFIGNSEDVALSEGLSRLNITSGSRTYRIPSPTRPTITRNSFQPSLSPPVPVAEPPVPLAEVSSLDADPTNQKGFYISFDDEQPKRPKPPLRTKKMSPKKERSYVETQEEARDRREAQERLEKKRQLERELDEERIKKDEEERRQKLIEQEREKLRSKREASQEREKVAAARAIIIGNELQNPDPDMEDEREKKKERIMLLSLQRRQQQEEAKSRKEAEAEARREKEKAKEEEKLRKKEEQVARRAAILEQYKLKKAIEEAEREGKTIERQDLMSLKPTPKMRPKASTRPRPKTIHIDSGALQQAEGMSSRGKKGSTSNLTAYAPSSTMKRDYYRGSQDSLADRNSMLYKDSPDDSHGMSPCHSANQTLGRRSSYKTSRDPSPAQVRGRQPKYNSTYQNFKGRKSNSMMNLYGSSTDQDSFAYRFGDTDSGLGRATPPRRAPSPGMSMRHLPSPSGPGSLPGLMSKGRRVFDDGSSDISSTPSSMMDYTGPRLYKQPSSKSNRSIMLNAVEYCVFPGVVNREAKKRVLEEINRSESKHFLILFRDGGCQFRALYSYCPDTEAVTKLYGTGPKQVNDKMFDKFFKYNSGGKCFSQVHTKHLTVTIDAFTIHNSLWQGKKVNLPNKKDMALVI